MLFLHKTLEDTKIRDQNIIVGNVDLNTPKENLLHLIFPLSHLFKKRKELL